MNSKCKTELSKSKRQKTIATLSINTPVVATCTLAF